MSKRKIVSFLLLLLLTVSVFIANIIIIENAKGQLPDVTQLTYDKIPKLLQKRFLNLKSCLNGLLTKA